MLSTALCITAIVTGLLLVVFALVEGAQNWLANRRAWKEAPARGRAGRPV